MFKVNVLVWENSAILGMLSHKAWVIYLEISVYYPISLCLMIPIAFIGTFDKSNMTYWENSIETMNRSNDITKGNY